MKAFSGLFVSQSSLSFWQLLVALSVGVLLSFLSIGPVRYVTGLPIAGGFVFLSIVGAIPTFFFLRHIFAGETDSSTATSPAGVVSKGNLVSTGAQATAFLLIALYAFGQLYNPGFLGFPVLGCADAGNHVMHKNNFVGPIPHLYPGFVGMYGAAGVLEYFLGMRTFESFRFCFYFTVFFLLSVSLLIAFWSSLYRSSHWVSWAVNFFVPLATGLASFRYVVLPLLHYYQADGFLAQVFGLVPLFLGLAGYVIVSNLWSRTAVILGAGVLLRYTYGLNLSDYFFTVAFLLLLEICSARLFWERLVLVALGLFSAGLAGVCLYKLTAIFVIPGAVFEMSVYRQSLSMVAFLVVCLGLLWLLRYLQLEKPVSADVDEQGVVQEISMKSKPPRLFSTTGGCFNRMLWFAVTYNVVTLGSLAAIRFLTNYEGNYYHYKYYFTALVLNGMLLPVVAMLVVQIIRDLWLNKGRFLALQMFGVLAAICLLSVGVYWSSLSLKYLMASYNERISTRKRYMIIRPLSDLEAERTIEKVLAERNKKLGGFMIDHWPTYHFMNQSLGYPSTFETYIKGHLTPQEGACVFWHYSASSKELTARGAVGAAKQLREMKAESGVEEVTYRTWLGHEREGKLYFKCY